MLNFGYVFITHKRISLANTAYNDDAFCIYSGESSSCAVIWSVTRMFARPAFRAARIAGTYEGPPPATRITLAPSFLIFSLRRGIGNPVRWYGGGSSRSLIARPC